jgi:hypothetical protein
MALGLPGLVKILETVVGQTIALSSKGGEIAPYFVEFEVSDSCPCLVE